jgi:serine/threonine protein kinase
MSESPEERNLPSLSQPEELVDRTIGEFRLLRRLGAGGMAEVYLAEQPSLGRVVAVKILQPDRIAGFDHSIVERFEREAKAAGGLSHSNIVQVYQTGEDGGIHFIVQEYIQGNNLSQQIRRVGPPELAQGLHWMQQIAEALHAANEAGIVHRDIKPENIMLTRELSAKVTDFGLAQLNQQGDQKNLTQTGTAMGTPLYMSPEQILGNKVDHRSDQYSFGVTCYHMFAGRPPFSSGNSVTVAVQHLQDVPPPLSQHRADLPPEVCKVIHRMLAKNPDDRYQSTSELLTVIASLQNLSVNTSLRTSNGAAVWLRDTVPTWRSAATVMVVTLAVGVLAGSLLTSQHRLPEISSEYERKESATEQFAAAMVNPGSESAWMAVTEYYPEQIEARFAQLHLALLHLTQVPPDLDQADAVLGDLLSWTDLDHGQHQLRALALATRVMVADRRDNETDERLYREQLFQEDLISEEELQDLIESAPRPLRNYWNRNQPRGLPQGPLSDRRGRPRP